VPPAITIDGEILTTLLQAFLDVFTLGIARLLPDARWILASLLMIELAVLGLWIAYGYHQNVAAALAEIGMKTAIYLLLITNWIPWTRALIKGFIAWGLLGSGNVMTEAQFSDPSQLAGFGIAAMALVYNRIFGYTGWDVLWNLPDILFTGFAASCCLVAFIILGIQVFLALLQFYGTSTATVVLIPWGMLKQTSFVAERAFAAIWAFAVKLLLLSLVAGAALPVMQKLSPATGVGMNFGQCVTLGIAGWAMVGAAFVVPKLAIGLLQGAPNLSSQDLSHFARATTQQITRLAYAMRAIARPNSPGMGAVTGRRRPI